MPFRDDARAWWMNLPLAILVGAAFCLGCYEVSDFDVWYHMRAGELIPTQGVPQKDWFTFKSSDEDWIDVHWGFQRIVATLHGRFGPAGLVAMKAAMGALAVLIGLLAYRRDWPAAVQFFVWIFPLLLMSSRFHERPEVFTLVFTAVFLGVLFHAENHPKLLWLLPAVQVCWANVQGLFVFGPILLGMYWAEAVLRIDHVKGLFRHLMPVTLAVFGACFVSPYTWKNLLIVVQISQVASGGVYRDNIAELRSIPTVWAEGAYTEVYVWLLVAVGAVAAFGVLAAWRSILFERRLFRLIPLVAFGYVGMQAVRNGNHFALVAGIVSSWNYGSLNWKRRSRGLTTLIAAVAGLLLVWAVVSERWHQAAAPTRYLGFGFRNHYYAFDAMRAAGRTGMPKRAFLMHNGHAATYTYFNYSPSSDRKIFSDARLEANSRAAFEEFLRIEKLIAGAEPSWDGILRREGVDLVGADGEHNVASQATLFAESGWVCISYDEVYAMFLRRGIPLPDGVQPVDFNRDLFQMKASLADLPETPPAAPWWWWRPPQEYYRGKSDSLATRLSQLSEALEQKHAPSKMRRSASLLAMRHGFDAAVRQPWKADSWRRLGYAAMIMAQRSLAPTERWSAPNGLFAATSASMLQTAIAVSPNDFYANTWLAAVVGSAHDLSLEPVERLPHVWAGTKQHLDFQKKQLPKLLAEKRKALSDARSQLKADTADAFADAQAAVSVGLLNEALRRLHKADLASLPPESIDRYGTWLLVAGRPAEARQVYLSSAAGKINAPLRESRLAACAFVRGRFSEVLDHVRKAGQHPEAAYIRGLLAMIEGDAAMAAEQLRAAASSPEEDDRRAAEILLELLPSGGG